MATTSFDFGDEANRFISKLETGITIHDAETGDIYFANEYAEELYGYDTDDLTTLDIIDITADSLSKADFLDQIQAAAAGRSQQFEWRIQRPSGEIQWIEIRLSEFTVDETSYVIAVVRDIDDFKMKLRHFHLLNRIVRHNFRNKLQIVSGRFNQIDNRTDDTKIFDHMRRAIAELVKLTNWVNRITSLSGEEKNMDRVNIRTILEAEVEKYERKHPDINWTLDSENVYIDANPLLQRAFHELIDNAVQHNDHEDLEITVTASENFADQQIDIQIIDTGQPIPDIEITPLLSRQEPDQLKHGKSVGLWEVQTIINRHQGLLRLKENNTERKVIEITLPLADPQ